MPSMLSNGAFGERKGRENKRGHEAVMDVKR